MRNTLWRVLLLCLLLQLVAQAVLADKPVLKCRTDGTFKLVMFSDLHHGKAIDPRTLAAMDKILDLEKPDMVVIAGDCVAGGDCDTIEELKDAIHAVGEPMEKQKLPWAIMFGNHDQEHFTKTKLSKEKVMKIYMSYPYNLNVRGAKKIHGVGNDYLLLKDSASKKPIFCLWLLDSGDYAAPPAKGYDWIHTDQVMWYYQISQRLEAKHDRKIPGLMFFHIPLREFAEMAQDKKYIGERNEDECPALMNGGLFAAALDRGDIKGIFCGHDHINDYVGNWFGIRLGYDYAAGYAEYGLPEDDPRNARGRGSRVFLIKESDPGNFVTWIRFEDGSADQLEPLSK